MSNRILYAMLLAFNYEGCKFPASLDDQAIVSGLRFTPSAFDSFRSTTQVHYTLKDPAIVSLSIVRRPVGGGEDLVKTLTRSLHESKGSHAHAWLGDTHNGVFAPPGEYIGILRVADQQFESAVRVFHN